MIPTSTKSFLNSSFPTFSLFVVNHKKLAPVLLALFLLAVVLVGTGFLGDRQTTRILSTNNTSRNIFGATAYGSQRHIFGSQNGLVAVYLNSNKQITASHSNDNGESWHEIPSPLVEETVENVSGALDKNGDLHLAYESGGNILYRKVSASWAVSDAVRLDISGFAHRPSLILGSASDLPAVVWSVKSEKASPRLGRILFLRAKGDPVFLTNWCNGAGSSCGIPAHILVSGSTDSLGMVASSALLHPVLVQMLATGDFYLFWSDSSPKGNEVLKRAIAKKEGDKWSWDKEEAQGELDGETFKNFSLAAVSDSSQNRILVAYVQKGGNTKIVAYKSDGGTEDLSPNQNLGRQFSLAVAEGEIYLFYQKENGKIGARSFETSWSEEILESGGEGGYPSVTTMALGEKLFLVYTTPQAKVDFLSYSLVAPTPTPTPTPTLGPTPTATATPSATLMPSPTPTIVPTPSPEATPTAIPIGTESATP